MKYSLDVGNSVRLGVAFAGVDVVLVLPPGVDPMLAFTVVKEAVAQLGPDILRQSHYPRDPDGTPQRVKLVGDNDGNVICAVELGS